METVFAILKILVPTLESATLKIKNQSGEITELELYDELDSRHADARTRWNAALEE